MAPIPHPVTKITEITELQKLQGCNKCNRHRLRYYTYNTYRILTHHKGGFSSSRLGIVCKHPLLSLRSVG